MSDIRLSKEDHAWLAECIRSYFETELDQEIGNMDAGFLIDFFAETAGPVFYNQGLRDAQALLSRKLEDVADELSAMEKLLPSRR
ncbi:DUF2164 domain-containing protein [Roseibium aggregatum]|uniref:DUF2164 domain-containing protein n=1 Tax=Roseibium aggregatum TaxID=187304 RepID=A0A926P561_9HYPH|nr:DUF2164 domain-containing protein [Roseibium aggregatum]MBD1548021.1 DUF2164 domain-containing protein [Roseibium aggregatum]